MTDSEPCLAAFYEMELRIESLEVLFQLKNPERLPTTNKKAFRKRDQYWQIHLVVWFICFVASWRILCVVLVEQQSRETNKNLNIYELFPTKHPIMRDELDIVKKPFQWGNAGQQNVRLQVHNQTTPLSVVSQMWWVFFKTILLLFYLFHLNSQHFHLLFSCFVL